MSDLFKWFQNGTNEIAHEMKMKITKNHQKKTKRVLCSDFLSLINQSYSINCQNPIKINYCKNEHNFMHISALKMRNIELKKSQK